jgi:hypothetical protein
MLWLRFGLTTTGIRRKTVSPVLALTVSLGILPVVAACFVSGWSLAHRLALVLGTGDRLFMPFSAWFAMTGIRPGARFLRVAVTVVGVSVKALMIIRRATLLGIILS